MIFLVQFGVNKHLKIFQRPQVAAPAKSGPLDFPSEKKVFLYFFFFAHEKGLGHMFQK